MKRATDFLVYLAVRLVVCAAQAMRIETGAMLARGMAWLFCDVLKLRYHVVDENLSCAFPHLTPDARRRLARQVWEHLFLLTLEVAHTPRKIHETNWRDYVRLHGKAEFMRQLIGHRPTVVVTGHLGNFEVGGYLLGVLGFPTHSVARPLDNPFLHRFVSDFRGRTGQHIISKNGGYDEIKAVMGSGGVMAFLADQYAGPKGCWVDFFGRPASAHKAIALLAFEYDAPVCVTVARRLGRPMQFELRLFASVDPRDNTPTVGGVRELTQWYSTRIEEMIRCWPDQYWWLHRRWKDTREKRPAARKVA